MKNVDIIFEMNWIKFSMFYLSVIVIFLCELSEAISDRYPDKPFPSQNLIYNRNVTCGESKGGRFPSKTWTCADIRVNNLRMAYGLYDGMDAKCTETKGFDELAELCRMMMKSIEVSELLWAAMVTDASCDYHNDKRVLLNRTKENFVWHDMGPGYGWIHTLQCMALKG